MKKESQTYLAIALNAYKYIVSGDFEEAINLYEEAIALEPEIRANYGYLGLAMLLQEREADAQMTWFGAVDDPEEIDDWVQELEEILNAEAERYSNQSELATAWLIRQHLAEISPQNLCNLVELTRLSLEQPMLDPDEQTLGRLIEVLEDYTSGFSDVEGVVLQNAVEQALVSASKRKINSPVNPEELKKLNSLQRNRLIVDIATKELKLSIALLQVYLQKLESSQRDKSINAIFSKLEAIPPQIALVYIKACLSFYPNGNRGILLRICVLMQALEWNLESVDFALQLTTTSPYISDQILGYYLATKGLLSAGLRWQEAKDTYSRCCDLLQILFHQVEVLKFTEARLIAGYGIFTYTLNDTHAAANHSFIKKLGSYYQFQICQILGGLPLSSNRVSKIVRRTKKLRVGYISASLWCHSVGWIGRWLLFNHNFEEFDVFVYSLTRTDDHIQESIKDVVTNFRHLTVDPDAPIVGIKTIAEQIQNDGIDILIELEGLLSQDVCAVIALKPAPIQVTWLGSDASGIPAIDYFIADPYVLPENAESYYNTKIWRLPQTYLAVNGFEVGTPNLCRADLDIPQDAIVYLSVQDPHKRHPEVIRDQMSILRQVPNSYFLIKSSGVSISFEEQFIAIALEEGVSSERLRFLPHTPTEEIHRANYAIADIILDTYPYNGATTTLEALWMELPIVTRVGEQFFARNSYTMMLNAGVTEGLAWTGAEYIKWGVRIGNDPDLRQQISWKLKQSKRTSPLWNTKQFTKEMEFAYEQMWAEYVKLETQALAINPSQLQAIAKAEEQNTQGIIFAQENKLDLAIACFRDATDINPECVESYYNLGIALDQKEEFEPAIASFQKVIDLNPEYANAYFNLGLVLTHQDKHKEAVSYFQKSLLLSPQDFEYHLSLGNALLAQKQWEEALTYYRKAIQINPKSVSLQCSIGLALGSQKKYTEAIPYLKSAINIDSQSAEAHNTLGWILAKLNNQQVDAIRCFETAINLDPSLVEAYSNLINLLNDDKSPLGQAYPLQKKLADQLLLNCPEKNRVVSLVNQINVYTKMGLGDQTQLLFDETEIFISSNSDRLTKRDIYSLYTTYTFLITSLRDNRQLNSAVFKLIGDLYLKKILKTESPQILNDNLPINALKLDTTKSDKKLRIGILSSFFCRHPVGWCSLDVIRELSNLTPHIYLYSTSEINPDELTQSFKNLAKKCFWQLKKMDLDSQKAYIETSPELNLPELSEVIAEINKDNLDVLVDLDSLTVPEHIQILYQKPATICLSWLGFDAPYISADNYYLCDWHTHPLGAEQDYVEKLVRLPDAHMAVSGFEVVSGISREDFGIDVDQIVYLYAAAGRKFNRDTAKAHVQILKNVPNSVLMYKGSGDRESIQAIYLNECEMQMIDGDRIKFMPSTKTAEEHRGFYGLADIFLDAYPYNGGSHNLEALWFNLPVVTRVGEQSFARMGYSFLQALVINEGIAKNWEEYVEWGVRLGVDSVLRNSIKDKLIRSKQPKTLMPLWNPRKMAQDMYNLLMSLVDERESNKQPSI